MIVTEIMDNDFVKTYSDENYYIRGGNPETNYKIAIDPVSEGRTYIETDIQIEEPDTGEDATEADFIQALEDLGVDLDEEE